MKPTTDRRDPNRAPKLRYLELDQHWRKTYGHPYPDRRQHEQPHAINIGANDISTQRQE